MNYDSSYWDELYRSNATAWDVGYPSTPLKDYIDQLNDKNLSILVPGCGNGYEVEYLLHNGFRNVTVIDISPLLTTSLAMRLNKWHGKELTILNGDFFAMEGQFDLVLEQTFFCALQPSLRKAYASQMHALLKKNGRLVGLLFNRAFEGGPPFGGSKTEYESLFQPLFEINVMADCYNSINPRAGTELFINLKPLAPAG